MITSTPGIWTQFENPSWKNSTRQKNDVILADYLRNDEVAEQEPKLARSYQKEQTTTLPKKLTL